jgi:glutathione synthase/RimK-type ligase-like ATP-grasp enzyme
MNNTFSKIIEEICNEERINLHKFSDGWLKVLEKNGKQKVIWDYKFDISALGSTKMCDDKYALYELMTHNKIKVPKSILLFRDEKKKYIKKNRTKEIKDFIKSTGLPLVLKRNDGICRSNIYFCSNTFQVIRKYRKITKASMDCLVSEYIKEPREFRVVMLNGNPEVSFEKIVSPDKRNIFKQHKLSKGARALNNAPESIINFAKKIQSIVDIKFASFDIMVSNNNFADPILLEINTGVTMENFANQSKENYQIAKKVYKNAVLAMFE